MIRRRLFITFSCVMIVSVLFLFTTCDLLNDALDDTGLADLDLDGILDSEDDDMDGDGVSNEDEITFMTNPRLADTDGDGWADGEEILMFDSADPYKFNPKIADLPGIKVIFKTTPSVTMQYETTEGTSEEFSTSEETSFSTEHSSSNSFSHSYAVEYGWSTELNVGTEFGFGPKGSRGFSFSRFTGSSDPRIGHWSMHIDATAGAHGTYTTDDTYSWETSQSISNSKAYSEAYAKTTETQRSQVGGKIEVDVAFKNTGNIAYTVNNMVLEALRVSPQPDGGLGFPIGNLSSDADDLTFQLAPGATSGTFHFVNDELYVSEVLELLGSSTGIICDVAGYSVSMASSEGEVDFSYESTTVSALTAKISIDYGPNVFTPDGGLVPPLQVNYGTRIKYNEDYTSMDDIYDPITLEEILDDLYITYVHTDATGASTGITSVNGVENDLANDKQWYLVHSYIDNNYRYGHIYSVETEEYDIGAIEVHSGDVVELIYSEDSDQDGLPVRVEAIIGTSDEDVDSDDDEISDFDEVNGWDLDGTEVYTNPTLADSDLDGLLDNEDPEPLTQQLSESTELTQIFINGEDLNDLYDTAASDTATNTYVLTDPIPGESIDIRVIPTGAVYSVSAGSVAFEQRTIYDYEAEIPFTDIGENTITMHVTALDTSVTETYTFTVESQLPAPTGFTIQDLDTENSLRLKWDLPDDPRITDMLIVRRDGAEIGSIVPELYEEGDTLGSGEVIKRYTVDGDFATDYLTIEDLSPGVDYYFAAVYVRYESSSVYYFSEAARTNAGLDISYGALTCQLISLESIDDNDGAITPDSEVYYDFRLDYFPGVGYQVAWRNYDNWISLDDDPNHDNHFYNFYTETTQKGLPPEEFGEEQTIAHMKRSDMWAILYVNIWEYDSSSNDDTYTETSYTLDYSLATDTWTFDGTAIPALPDKMDVKEFTYTGSAGTIKLRMRFYYDPDPED